MHSLLGNDFFLCKNSFACAGKTLSERADSSPYPGFDFCAIATDFLQSGGARAETEGMARLAVAVSDGFVSGCCGFAGVLPHERDVSGNL